MNTELLGALEERGATYGLLGRLYNREVDEDLLKELRRLSWTASGEGRLAEGAHLMGEYLASCAAPAQTELAVDFARLFLVRTSKTKDAPYPYESVYTSDEHITMADARDAVLASYREEGLSKCASWHLAEDHLALELEFEQVLCTRTINALRTGDEAEAQRLLNKQGEFLTQHLLSWTEPFFEAMEHTAHTSFYRGLARFTEGFLEEDNHFLASLVGQAA